MSSYRDEMIVRFWKYQKEIFHNQTEIFEGPDISDRRPPVFKKHNDAFNVLMAPGISSEEHGHLLKEIPARERHRWFRSMSSSQAIALSVFGNLKLHGCLALLNELVNEYGQPIFGKEVITPANFRMEYKVDCLGEPRPTSLDACILGKYCIAIECKLMESEIGSCSRPRLTIKESNYDKDFCDGTYTVQRGRASRCALTEIGVTYWNHVPGIFRWRTDSDLHPCPLRSNYQLVRNLLAASVQKGNGPNCSGHAVMIYDERNPAFNEGGKGYAAYEETRKFLREPGMLKICSWQKIINLLKEKNCLTWLTEQVGMKYGF